MTVIAMTRELGTLGKEVAHAVAKRLGLRVVYKELVGNLAERMHLPISTVGRYVTGREGIFDRLVVDGRHLALYTAQEILDTALAGSALIRDWGATHLLSQVPHVMRVRVCAPMALRVERQIEKLDQVDVDLARREILLSDSRHARIMLNLFGVTDPGNEKYYDLVLDTENAGVEQCADDVVRLAQRPQFRETDSSRAILHSLALQARARAALLREPETAELDISISVDHGTVMLEGTADDSADVGLAARIIAGLPGVCGVENRITTSF